MTKNHFFSILYGNALLMLTPLIFINFLLYYFLFSCTDLIKAHSKIAYHNKMVLYAYCHYLPQTLVLKKCSLLLGCCCTMKVVLLYTLTKESCLLLRMTQAMYPGGYFLSFYLHCDLAQQSLNFEPSIHLDNFILFCVFQEDMQ